MQEMMEEFSSGDEDGSGELTNEESATAIAGQPVRPAWAHLYAPPQFDRCGGHGKELLAEVQTECYCRFQRTLP